MTGAAPMRGGASARAGVADRPGYEARRAWTALWAAALCAAIGAACAVRAPSARPPASPPLALPERTASLELIPYLGKLRTVEVEVAGHARRFLFDTGGGLTLVTPALAAEAGCVRGAPVTVTRFDGGTLELETCSPLAFRAGGLPLAPLAPAVFDFSRLLPAEAPPLDGLASLQTFADRRMTIDLGAGWITLASAPADDGAAFEPLEARFMRDDPPGRLDLHLGVRGRTRTLWFEADSGNLDAVLVSPDAVAELGLGAEVSAQLARGDVVHARIAILGLEPLDVALRSSPMIYDGLLNAAVLERLVLVVDATAERAFAGSSAEGPRLRPPRPGCRRRGQLARAALSVARSARGSGRGGATPRAMR